MINIYYIFCNPANNWNLKKAGTISVIRQDEDKLKLAAFAHSLCRNNEAELFILDCDGNISSRLCFSNKIF